MSDTDSNGLSQAGARAAFELPAEIWEIILREATTIPASMKYPSPMIDEPQIRALREEKKKYYQRLVCQTG